MLDCTLRDGGYVNDWNFGKDNIRNIIDLLNKSGIDFIETGFLTKEKSDIDKTLFNSISDIQNILPTCVDKSKLLAMIAYSHFPADEVPSVQESCVGGIRFIFKKFQSKDALIYANALKDKGYRLFVNPTYIDQYTDEELLSIIKIVNDIKPFAFSIVDSLGVLKEDDIKHLFEIINNSLNEEITLCFHAHNNLQLSFSNAQTLMNISANRNIITDSTIFGIGRGAGNIKTELLAKYLNDKYHSNYNVVPILQAIHEYINPIFKKTPWGYSVPYYLAAINHCHPDYAKYLSKQDSISIEAIDKILKNIPSDKKTVFDEKLLKTLISNAIVLNS